MVVIWVGIVVSFDVKIIIVDIGMENAAGLSLIVDIVVENVHDGWILWWKMQYITCYCGYCSGKCTTQQIM